MNNELRDRLAREYAEQSGGTTDHIRELDFVNGWDAALASSSLPQAEETFPEAEMRAKWTELVDETLAEYIEGGIRLVVPKFAHWVWSRAKGVKG